jgi:hypothetical protein
MSRSGATRTSNEAGRITKIDCSKTRVKSKPSRQAASTTGPNAASAAGAQEGFDIFMMGQIQLGMKMKMKMKMKKRKE